MTGMTAPVMTTRAGRLTGVTILSYTGVMTIAGNPGRGVARRERHWRMLRWAAAAALLSVPWFMMQVSDAWDWRPESFVLLGTMLASALGAYELAVRMSGRGSWTYRAGAALAIATGFVLVWMNLAVGIIGPEDNPANLMYGGALLVGAVGAAMARLEPRGMALASFATALALLLVAALAASFWWNESPGRIGLLFLNGTFAAMYLAAAWLFRKAAWS